MRKNCNLELPLLPPSPLELRLRPPSSPFQLRQQNHNADKDMVGEDLKEKQSQQLTIFYDGKVSVCDVTELQAREIIKLASKEMDEKLTRTSSPSPVSTTTSPSPSSSSPLFSGNYQGGLSMKRSLQRFLQKRKHRIQQASPYHP